MSTGKKKSTLKVFREKTNAKASKELLDMTREEGKIRAAITKVLSSGPKTIPEIAKETGMDIQKVTWYVLTFVRYSVFEPIDQTEDGYWRYRVVKKKTTWG